MTTDDLINLIGWKWDAFHVAIAAGVLGRLWHAAGGWRGFMKLGGLVGVVKSLLFGTNTPNPPPPKSL